MDHRRNRLLYPLIFGAVASVATFSGIGIAAITGHLSISQGGYELFLPTAMTEQRFAAVAIQTPVEPSYVGLTRQSGSHPAPTTKPFEYRRGQRLNHAQKSCATCGVVQSIEPRTQQTTDHANVTLNSVTAEFNGGGKVLKAALSSAGNGGVYADEREPLLDSYVVRVKMEDGSFRTIYEHQRPPFSIGERVKLVNGSVVTIG